MPSADSITAVVPSSRHAASTGSPNGPVTVVSRFAPPNAASVPSPPSAIGSSSQSQPASFATAMHRAGHLLGGGRAPELVGRSDDPGKGRVGHESASGQRTVGMDPVEPPLGWSGARPPCCDRLEPRPGLVQLSTTTARSRWVGASGGLVSGLELAGREWRHLVRRRDQRWRRHDGPPGADRRARFRAAPARGRRRALPPGVRRHRRTRRCGSFTTGSGT